MKEENLLCFYKHSNEKSEIGWESCIDSHVIGPNLQKTFKILSESGLQKRGYNYSQDGGWSGDLYVVHRRLFKFQNEISRFMGDSGGGGNFISNVYEVIINSTSGWAQYLSVILKGELEDLSEDETVKDNVEKLFNDIEFAPKYSYLAKNDPVSLTSGRPEDLWLDEIVEVPTPPFKIDVA